MYKKTLLAFFLVLSLNGLQGQQNFALTHVHVIDPASKKIFKDQSLYIENAIIKMMGRSISIPAGVKIINGNGKYLLPGLAEMHAHIPVPDSAGSLHLIQQTLSLFLVNGVTTIRGMLGQPYHLNINEKMKASGIASPQIYTSSPSFNGNTVPDEGTAEHLVRLYKNEGYHFLKIHPGIKLPVYDALVKTAKEVGIDFAGHVPVQVGIQHAVQSGQKTIDHIDGLIEALAPPLKDLNQNGFFGFNVTDDIDLKKLGPLVAAIKKSGAWIVPTQSLFSRWFSPEDPKSMINSKEMSYMPSRTRFAWIQSKTSLLATPGYNSEKYHRFLKARQKILYEFYKQGVPLLMGSDAPQVMNVPGFSIHHEMQSWADAGIPNWEILKAATCTIAQFYNDTSFGQIAVGKSANFILLAANPVSDIKNSLLIEGVMAPTTSWMTKEDIKKILDHIESTNE